jgi:hypothetical protein
MEQADCTAVFILTPEETQQWRDTEAGREAIKAAIADQLAYPGTDHFRICVLSAASQELLWFD